LKARTSLLPIFVIGLVVSGCGGGGNRSSQFTGRKVLDFIEPSNQSVIPTTIHVTVETDGSVAAGGTVSSSDPKFLGTVNTGWFHDNGTFHIEGAKGVTQVTVDGNLSPETQFKKGSGSVKYQENGATSADKSYNVEIK
jgi:hypothetical protein